MTRYGQYKDSGVQWLGEIPAHWEVKRLGSYFNERRTKVSDKYYTPLSVTKNGIYPQLENVAKTNDGDNRKLVLKNDFVINSRSDRKGSSGVSQYDGSVSLINIVLIPNIQKISHYYCHYLFRSYSFIEEYYRNGRGIVADLWTTRYEEMKMIKIAIPSYSEQDAIVAYLDSEVSKIDEAIKQQQKMIELLNERRQIIISEAVTKGLNPDVKKANNNVEEIGLIPEHWLLRKFKRVAKVQANLVSPKRYSDFPQVAPENIEKGTGKLLEYTTVSESGVISDNHLFHAGQIIYSKIRPSLNKLIIAPFDGLCSADMYPITTSMNVRFLYYYMLSKPFVTQVNKVVMDRVKMPKINKEELSLIYVLVPPVKEQEDIINYLDNRLKSLDMTIARCKNITDRLTERKRIIINEAVTGKIKVL